MKLNIYTLFATFAIATVLAIPVAAQEKNNTRSESSGFTSQRQNRTPSSSREDKKQAKFIRKLEGVWRRSNKVYKIELSGNSIQIENVAFYDKCRLVGTSGRVWKGSVIGNQIRGVYRKMIRGKTIERSFTAEISANGKQIVLRFKEPIYLDPVGDTPAQIVDFAVSDKLRKN